MTILSQTARRTPSTLKRATFAAVLMGGLLLTACGGTTPIVDPPPVTAPAVSSVTVTPTGTSLAVGATQQLKADVMGSGAYSTAVTWSVKSGDTTVLSVDANGLVTAKAAGTATVVATSTTDTSKSGSVIVTVKAAVVVTPPPPAFVTVKVNFQPANFTTPAGYIPDTGAAFNTIRNFGWITQASAGTATAMPLDLIANTRDRSAVSNAAPELNTFIHMQYSPTGTMGNPTPGAWEYTVPNGSYTVTVAVGDANSNFLDSTNAINVEGTAALVPPFTPTATQPFKTGTVTVTVTDGKLTLDAKAGTNTKLDYVTIAAATAAAKY